MATKKQTSTPAASAPANPLADQMAGDASSILKTTLDSKVVLARVTALVATQRNAEKAVAEAEKELKTAKAALFKIESEDMPELLREAGLLDITLEDGTKVKRVDEISCAITEERSPQCFAWLRDHGYGGLIRTAVSVSFGADPKQLAAADKLFVTLLKKYGAQAEQSEKVHPATLKAFIKERIAEANKDAQAKANVPPFELFSVVPYSMAKIAATKAKKDAALTKGGAA